MKLRFKMPGSRLLKDQKRLGDLLWSIGKASVKAPVKVGTRTRARSPEPKRLVEVEGFGPNPGNLRMFEYIPAALAKNAPLVVVIHGCRQTAADYDRGSGWSRLAQERGFAVVYPEQKPSNNPARCFNWFRPSEVTRDRGELMSIRQMITSISERAKIDRKRIFVTGLSAGGAMTSALLANYPELFRGGAIIAGLPFGTARDATRALDAMKKAPERSPAEWGDFVRKISPVIKSPPLVSIWHGTADRTVDISNGEANLAQWLDVFGLDPDACSETIVDGQSRRLWRDRKDTPLIEYYTVSGMGHGTPLKPRMVRGKLTATPGSFMLDAGISSTEHLAKSWGLTRTLLRKPV
jgi:poly(hydroxyalkanoate) depolymerase family esterase